MAGGSSATAKGSAAAGTMLGSSKKSNTSAAKLGVGAAADKYRSPGGAADSRLSDSTKKKIGGSSAKQPVATRTSSSKKGTGVSAKSPTKLSDSDLPSLEQEL